jgi:hypothetical protein
MAESVAAWWARRQFSRDADVPYAVGTYRDAWAPYPALIRQYHPELNDGITLTQIPPAAEVLLLWQCEAGHLFAATPSEQRRRPGRQRRRSAWCPECAALARPTTPRPADDVRARARAVPARRVLCSKTPDLPVGEAFTSECAPPTASAVEARLRQSLSEALEFTAGRTAVRVGRPFFDHLEVWPDIVIPELRITVEYDSPGRHGLEHVGRREEVDRRKDRLLRAAQWEVVRVRTGRLAKLGPYDLQVTSTARATVGRLLDTFRAIRGDLIVDAYLH